MKSLLLTEDQKTHFRDEGYLVLENVLTDQELQPLIDEISSEIDRKAKELYQKGEITDLHENEGFETRLAKLSEQSPKVALSMWNGALHLPAIFHLIGNPKLLDIASAFCGEEIVASSVYRLRPKIPNFGYGAVPWHQDSGYFEPFCDNSLIITMWIPMVDADEDNGCMFVIPGSHKNEVVEHEMHESGKYLSIKDEFVPKENWVACPVKKGGVLLLTNRVMHASFMNKTDAVRWSMDLRYQSADLPTNANITRFKNDWVENEESGVPSACYPPDPDFLVRSSTRQDEIITTYEEFKQLKDTFQGKPVANRFNVAWREMKEEDV